MKYRHSDIDRYNLKWFSTDMTRATLASVSLVRGNVRGLTRFKIDFEYPISVIAGKNGTGKSTILALAACAFHNHSPGFSLPSRKTPYYTMSDFFVQSEDEVNQDGITLQYAFLYNDWRTSARFPDGVGRGSQYRTKKRGGRWSNYSRRVHRNVVFFGIERVVPHSERSVSKSYRSYLKRVDQAGFEDEVREIVGRILGRPYEAFWFRGHSRYRVPHVQTKRGLYSGFNMGAGENALFEIFSSILAAPKGLLVIVDEIELGLHEAAQGRLIAELKKLALERKIQVICTTHSPTILRGVPPEGRFYLEQTGTNTLIVPGISPEFAAGRLAEKNSQELDIFIEDGVARHLVQSALGANIRRRVNLLPIGSASALVRQMAARYNEKSKKECVIILDGDQKVKKNAHLRSFLGDAGCSGDDVDAKTWFCERLGFTPGDSWPERWIFSTASEYEIAGLADELRIDAVELGELIESANRAGKHKEFPKLASDLSIPASDVVCTMCRWIASVAADEFKPISELIATHLQ